MIPQHVQFMKYHEMKENNYRYLELEVRTISKSLISLPLCYMYWTAALILLAHFLLLPTALLELMNFCLFLIFIFYIGFHQMVRATRMQLAYHTLIQRTRGSQLGKNGLCMWFCGPIDKILSALTSFTILLKGRSNPTYLSPICQPQIFAFKIRNNRDPSSVEIRWKRSEHDTINH